MAAVRPRPTRARKRARCSLHLSSSASSSSSQVEKPSLDQGSRPPLTQILQRRENQEAFGEGGGRGRGGVSHHSRATKPSQEARWWPHRSPVHHPLPDERGQKRKEAKGNHNNNNNNKQQTPPHVWLLPDQVVPDLRFLPQTGARLAV